MKEARSLEPSLLCIVCNVLQGFCLCLYTARPPVQVTVATTTCASRVSALVGHRKRPPVQVTVATTTCASRVSALVGHRKRPPVQVTVAPGQHMHAPFAPPHVPESECAQWLKKKTTSASYSRAVPAPPPLECTLQQANVSLPKGMPLN